MNRTLYPRMSSTGLDGLLHLLHGIYLLWIRFDSFHIQVTKETTFSPVHRFIIVDLNACASRLLYCFKVIIMYFIITNMPTQHQVSLQHLQSCYMSGRSSSKRCPDPFLIQKVFSGTCMSQMVCRRLS